MEKVRKQAPQVGLAMGLIFLVAGITNSNFGIVGLGVVVGLVGYFSRQR